jgi:hypothetical protein
VIVGDVTFTGEVGHVALTLDVLVVQPLAGDVGTLGETARSGTKKHPVSMQKPADRFGTAGCQVGDVRDLHELVLVEVTELGRIQNSLADLDLRHRALGVVPADYVAGCGRADLCEVAVEPDVLRGQAKSVGGFVNGADRPEQIAKFALPDARGGDAGP